MHVPAGSGPTDLLTATTLRVLLVEDDDGDAFLFEELLRDADLVVEVARERTVASAERLLPADVACVVLDLGLPDADGLAALHRLRDVAPNVPMLVLTGLSDTARGLEAVAAGAGTVRLHGSLWSARSLHDDDLPAGTAVVVVEISGATAVVTATD